MNLLKKGEGVPLLNIVGSPGVPLLNFRGFPGPTFKLWGGGGPGPGSWGPGPTFIPCQLKIYILLSFFDHSFEKRRTILKRKQREGSTIDIKLI